jgi:hypothetical protein
MLKRHTINNNKYGKSFSYQKLNKIIFNIFSSFSNKNIKYFMNKKITKPKTSEMNKLKKMAINKKDVFILIKK